MKGILIFSYALFYVHCFFFQWGAEPAAPGFQGTAAFGSTPAVTGVTEEWGGDMSTKEWGAATEATTTEWGAATNDNWS